MGVRIAEYFGQPVDRLQPIIPVNEGRCPFANIQCSKIKESYKPVCCVRKTNGILWIVCRDRLCSTKGDALTEYQRDILRQIAREIFDPRLEYDEIIYKKEVGFKLREKKRVTADFIVGTRKLERLGRGQGPRMVMVEMQGGGSTSSTGGMTRHVKSWENNNKRTNEILGSKLKNVNSIENDSWKRQQDQLIIKSHIAQQSGFGFVLCAGKALYDYIKSRLDLSRLDDLRNARWDFVLLPMIENRNNGRIGFTVDAANTIYTTFHNFSGLLTSQGKAQTEKFFGEFRTLSGNQISISQPT